MDRHGGEVRKIRMDVNLKPFRRRLWSIRDSQLVYYATHFAEARRVKKLLIRQETRPVPAER